MFLSIRLFIPAPSHLSPWPSCSLSPLLHSSAHPPNDHTTLLPVHPPSLHVCPSDHPWSVRPAVQHIFSVRAQGQPCILQRSGAWSLDPRKLFSESVLPGVSSVHVFLNTIGKREEASCVEAERRASCGDARSHPQGMWALWKEAQPSRGLGCAAKGLM